MNVEPQRWLLRSIGESEARSASGKIAPILEQLLRQRGFPTGEGLEAFLRPRLKELSDPFRLPGMEEAVGRILLAIERGEEICLFGDYDVDGVSSITVMVYLLRAYGVEARSFIPRRSHEGYGLSLAALRRLLEEGVKPDLLISVDCGTVSVDEIEWLKERGVDVVVVDHHEPSPYGLPDCAAVLNPKRGDELTYLCAAGVAFKLGHGMMMRRRVDFDLRSLMVFVAVATVADIVPLIGENRLFVRYGLEQLPKTSNFGLRALQKITGMGERVTSQDVGFRIGPRLNAAGRMDVPEDALATLLSTSEESADVLSVKLNEYNLLRQQEEVTIWQEALKMLEGDFDAERDAVIVLGSRAWHPGVVGIVASRLMKRYYRPTFVVAIDENGVGKGSGRSIAGVSLVAAIHDCHEVLVAGGGHEMAAGISIREENLGLFREKFNEYVVGNAPREALLPTLMFDAEIGFDELSMEFLDHYELLQPFGSGNPVPVFVARNVELARAPMMMKNQHVKLILRQGYAEFEAIFFGAGARDFPDPPWDVAFHVDRNTFRGRTMLQLVVQDLRASEGISHEA